MLSHKTRKSFNKVSEFMAEFGIFLYK